MRVVLALIALTLSAPASLTAATACPPPAAPPERIHPQQRPAPTPVNPWGDADSARADRLLDVAASLVETLTPLGDDRAAGRKALVALLDAMGTSPGQLVAEGEWFSRRNQEDPVGMGRYATARLPRLQRLAEAAQRLSPAQIDLVTETFMGR